MALPDFRRSTFHKHGKTASRRAANAARPFARPIGRLADSTAAAGGGKTLEFSGGPTARIIIRPQPRTSSFKRKFYELRDSSTRLASSHGAAEPGPPPPPKAPALVALEHRVAALTADRESYLSQLAAASRQVTVERLRAKEASADRDDILRHLACTVRKYGKLADKYNELCSAVCATTDAPLNQIDPFGTMDNHPEFIAAAAHLTKRPKVTAAVDADLGTASTRHLSAHLGVRPLPPPPANALDVFPFFKTPVAREDALP